MKKLILLSLLLSGFAIGTGNVVLAQETPEENQQQNAGDIKNIFKDQFNDFGGNIISDIQNQFTSLFGDVIGFFKGVEDINRDILNVVIPDWEIVQQTVESVPTTSKELAQQLENRTSDGFHNIQNESETLQRELIADAVSESTTSIEAQQATAETLIQVEEVLKRSGELSEDSSNSDVSQQILQNLSEQNGINSQLLGLISSQNIQAQRDRANQINLSLQTARHLSIANNRARREAILAAEYGSTAWGVLSTPIFLYEETP